MKLVVQLQLVPDAESARKLRESVERFNEAANWLAGIAFDQQISNKISLQKIAYQEVRERFGLSSQMACLCIHRVCEAYRRDKSKRPKFRTHSAMSYDIRTMSFKGIDRVSLLTLEGRVLVPFLLGSYQAERLPQRKGQCDLVLRKDGKWFLIVTIDVPEGTPIPVTDFIGVDMGIARVATASDNAEGHCGQPVERIRRKHNDQTKRLQRKGTRGAKKKLVRVSGKEAKFRKHQNHCISKTIVESAKRTGRGIAIENLEGIWDGSRLGAETLRTSCRAGRSTSSRPFSRTRQRSREFPSCRSTLATPRRRAASVGIANGATGRAKPNSSASTAGSPRTPIGTLPGISGHWQFLVTLPELDSVDPGFGPRGAEPESHRTSVRVEAYSRALDSILWQEGGNVMGEIPSARSD